VSEFVLLDFNLLDKKFPLGLEIGLVDSLFGEGVASVFEKGTMLVVPLLCLEGVFVKESDTVFTPISGASAEIGSKILYMGSLFPPW